jgi:cytochrome c-type biogenesis protein
VLEIPLVFAFTAGLISFLSPCVLPLIPGYLAYLAGTSLGQAEQNRWQVFLNSMFFVLGFSVVFALLGVLLNSVLSLVASDVQTWLSRIGGIVVILFGLYLTGLLKPGFLNQERKINVTHHFSSKLLTSFVFGAAFAVGWTPCVGAVLGSILALAATQPGLSFGLLFAYSIGLGLPFLVVGLFASHAAAWVSKIGPYLKYLDIAFGILLIIFGILIFTESLPLIANFGLLNSLLLSK